MKLNSKILEAIKRNNNLITTNQVIELGFSKTLLTKYVKAGLLERCIQGVYSLPDTLIDDLYIFMLHSNKIIFSHDSALFLNGISDRTPFKPSITIPSNSALPNTIKGECNCFYIKPELHELGLIEKKTTFGNVVRCYNAERTVCDFLRSRNRCDEEMVVSAIKNYASSPNKNLNLLSFYSEQLNVEKELKRYMEVLL